LLLSTFTIKCNVIFLQPAIYGTIIILKMMNNLFLKAIISLVAISHSWSQQIAFPGAEGFGKYTKGGRGGVVYEVTNLNDSGEGSLRTAVEASGPRTVVFTISGTIELESPLRIKHPYLTIAGQTAPGDGICIRKYPVIIDADHVIIRFLRIRLGDESGGDYDAISARFVSNIILDHVSASWSVDETVSIYHCDSITVQWCIVSESMFQSNHIKGSHGFGGIWGSNRGTYHHNLLAHHSSRNPRMASGSGNTDYRNNVIYNWGYQSLYGGEKYQKGNDKFNFSSFNIIANYYKPGPATKPGEVMHRIASPSYRNETDDFGKWFIADNVVEGNANVTADNWDGGVQTKISLEKIKLDRPWPSMPINLQTVPEAYHSVLENAGAILPVRDAVDSRIIEETRGGFATYEGVGYKEKNKVSDPTEKCGIIDTQDDVGGWPLLKSAPAPKDTDHDGIPDEWELNNGLDPNNAGDRNAISEDGYTMLEKYLNSIN
jgi:pectate lyase